MKQNLKQTRPSKNIYKNIYWKQVASALAVVTLVFSAIAEDAHAQRYQRFSSGRDQDTGFKFAITAYQLIGLQGNFTPMSGEIFLGERLSNFGDVGIFGQGIAQKDGKASYALAGVNVTPRLLKAIWGGLYWKNKLGYGIYDGQNQMMLSTGLTLEPGSFFHITVEILNSFSLKPQEDNYPAAGAIGLGFHFN